jgi:hypothetical protein
MSVTRELAEYKLYLGGIQKIRCDYAITEREGNYIFFYEKEKENSQMGIGFSMRHRRLSEVKSVDFC